MLAALGRTRDAKERILCALVTIRSPYSRPAVLFRGIGRFNGFSRLRMWRHEGLERLLLMVVVVVEAVNKNCHASRPRNSFFSRPTG